MTTTTAPKIAGSKSVYATKALPLIVAEALSIEAQVSGQIEQLTSKIREAWTAHVSGKYPTPELWDKVWAEGRANVPEGMATLDAKVRDAIAVTLTGEDSMSVRAIATALGASKSAIGRAVKSVEKSATVGADGTKRSTEGNKAPKAKAKESPKVDAPEASPEVVADAPVAMAAPEASPLDKARSDLNGLEAALSVLDSLSPEDSQEMTAQLMRVMGLVGSLSAPVKVAA